MSRKYMIKTGLLLGTFAIIGTSLLAITNQNTKQRIADNERAALLRSLHILISPDKHDNDIFHDIIKVKHPRLLGSRKPVTVYRARMNNAPVAAVLTPVAPDGYNGKIKLLVAIYRDGTLGGVRVLSHKETPGLGDYIDEDKSDWITGFANRSLSNPKTKGWQVKRDGGIFDQFTGATITPRAVVTAVYNTLQYFAKHRDLLFTPMPAEPQG